MWQSLEILNVFNTLILTQIFWKAKTFSEKLKHRFAAENTKIEGVTFEKPILMQTEWKVQNEPLTKNGVLPVTTLFLLWVFFQYTKELT